MPWWGWLLIGWWLGGTIGLVFGALLCAYGHSDDTPSDRRPPEKGDVMSLREQ